MKAVTTIASVFFVLILIVYGIARGYVQYRFDVDCGAHLVRAANAPTIPLALESMDTVLAYCEEHGKTQGHSDIFLNKPENDVGYWYERLVSARDELRTVQADASSMAATNLLMKLRETITDNGNLTLPTAIATFPNHIAWAFWGWTITILTVISILSCIAAFNVPSYPRIHTRTRMR